MGSHYLQSSQRRRRCRRVGLKPPLVQQAGERRGRSSNIAADGADRPHRKHSAPAKSTPSVCCEITLFTQVCLLRRRGSVPQHCWNHSKKHNAQIGDASGHLTARRKALHDAFRAHLGCCREARAHLARTMATSFNFDEDPEVPAGPWRPSGATKEASRAEGCVAGARKDRKATAYRRRAPSLQTSTAAFRRRAPLAGYGEGEAPEKTQNDESPRGQQMQ